jgi:hypothetical protein
MADAADEKVHEEGEREGKGIWHKRWVCVGCPLVEACSDNSWQVFNKRRWWSMEECMACVVNHLQTSSLHTNQLITPEDAKNLADSVEYEKKDTWLPDAEDHKTHEPCQPEGPPPKRGRLDISAEVARQVEMRMNMPKPKAIGEPLQNVSHIIGARRFAGGFAGGNPLRMLEGFGSSSSGDPSNVILRKTQLQSAIDSIRRAKDAAANAHKLLASASRLFAEEANTLGEAQDSLQALVE